MVNVIRTPEQLALVLRGRRNVAGLTQQAAGSSVGLLPKTIHALESTPERCRVESLFKLLSALDFELVLQPKQPRTRNARREW